MANILLLDDSDVAARAMQGILTRGNHRLAVAGDTIEARRLLRELIKIDLLFLELKLKGENGILFLQHLRNDCYLKQVPVVVYTGIADHNVVKKALSMTVQNYLIKPYDDETINKEIAKATINPWRNLLFEEEKSFCAQMGIQPDDLRKMRLDLMAAIDAATSVFPGFAESKKTEDATSQIAAMSESAQAAGFWGLVDYLTELQAKLEEGNWTVFKHSAEELQFASRLLFCHLNPTYTPEGLVSEQERKEQMEARDRAVWLGADAVKRCPLVSAEEVQRQLDGLPGCPVIDTVIAGFQMTADGRAASMSQVMDLVSKDPGLTTQVLIAANHLEREDMNTTIDDPRLACSLLGDLKLAALAKALPAIEERYMHSPPITWAHFWMFQMGVARLAQFTCRYLEFTNMSANAYTAGLVHDIGKLLLLRLYPFGFLAMVNHAKQNSIPLHEAEKKFIGWTTRDMAYRFAQTNALPPAYCNVIRWVERPEDATEDAELVAVVSLARHVCLHNHVGYCGDTPKDYCPPIEETTAWGVLRPRVFPSFNLKKFELQAHGYCSELKQTLVGRQH